MQEIELKDILSYKIKKRKNYLLGGFYMIKNIKTNKCYIGKSIDYLARLRQHLYKSNSKNLVDIELRNNVSDFKFYLLENYIEYDINFFNRKLEIKIEHRFIKKHKSYHPIGYNISYYEHI